jgi:hypothetical protein
VAPLVTREQYQAQLCRGRRSHSQAVDKITEAVAAGETADTIFPGVNEEREAVDAAVAAVEFTAATQH